MGELIEEKSSEPTSGSPSGRVRAFLRVVLEEDLSEDAQRVLKHLESSELEVDALESDDLAGLLLEGLK